MDDERHCDAQTWQCKTIGDPLYQLSGRSKGWRGNVRATVVVHHYANDEVNNGHHALTDEQGARVLARILHLRHNGEEGRRSSVSKDQRGQRRGRFGEARIVCDFVIGFPFSRRRWRWLFFDRNSDGNRLLSVSEHSETTDIGPQEHELSRDVPFRPYSNAQSQSNSFPRWV